MESSPVSVESQAVLPSGFLSRAGRSGATSGSGVSGLFSLSAYSETAYESNPSLGLGSQGVQGSDGYILLGGEINFQREIREFEVELSYYGDYQHYFKKSSLSNDFHEANLTKNLQRFTKPTKAYKRLQRITKFIHVYKVSAKSKPYKG